MIKLDNITVQIASKILLENASMQISDGQKVGIVGTNGCGKTTLFKVLKGEHDVNSGEAFCSPNQQKAFVEQEIAEKDLSLPILNYVLGKDKKLAELRRKYFGPQGEMGKMQVLCKCKNRGLCNAPISIPLKKIKLLALSSSCTRL